MTFIFWLASVDTRGDGHSLDTRIDTRTDARTDTRMLIRKNRASDEQGLTHTVSHSLLWCEEDEELEEEELRRIEEEYEPPPLLAYIFKIENMNLTY